MLHRVINKDKTKDDEKNANNTERHEVRFIIVNKSQRCLQQTNDERQFKYKED